MTSDTTGRGDPVRQGTTVKGEEAPADDIRAGVTDPRTDAVTCSGLTYTFGETTAVDALDLNAPPDPANALAKLKYEDELVKIDVGYRPSAHLKEAMKRELEHTPPLLKVAPNVASLLKKVTRPDAKHFLDEAHLCLRVNAPRAAIVLTWIVVIDHF